MTPSRPSGDDHDQRSLPRTAARPAQAAHVPHGAAQPPVATVLVVLYYVLPLDERLNALVAVRLLIGLGIFAAMATWQARTIIGARYPAVKAVEALGLILPLYLLLFASTYFVMQRASAANFTQPLTRTDALYFAVTVFFDGGIRGHRRQVRGRPGGAHLPDARGPRASGRGGAGTAGRRAPRPAARIRYGWRHRPGRRVSARPGAVACQSSRPVAPPAQAWPSRACGTGLWCSFLCSS